MTGVAVIYLLLRLRGLSDACLWFDEIFSVQAAEQPWGNFLSFIAQDLVHPPLFYLLLKGWIAIGGESVLWLRLLPVIFACFALIPFYLIARELRFDLWTIIFGMFLMAVNGSLINYTQRVRMYTLLMALTLLSIWLFLRFVRTGKGIVPLILVNLLVINTQYYGWAVIGCEVVYLLAFRREKWRYAAALVGSAAVAFAPWALAVISAARSGSDPQQNIGWIDRPGISAIWTFIIDAVEPIYFQLSSDEPASIYRISIPVLAILIVAVAAFIFARRGEADDNDRQHILLIFSFLPIIFAFVVSWVLPYSVWGVRHLIVSAGPGALLVAAMISRISVGNIRIASVTLMMLFSCYAFYYTIGHPHSIYIWCEWDRIGSEAKSGETLYALEDMIAYHLWYASRNKTNENIAKIEDFPEITEDRAYFLPRGFDGVKKLGIEDINTERFHLVFRTTREEQKNSVIKRLMDRGYKTCSMMSQKIGIENNFDVELAKVNANCEDR